MMSLIPARAARLALATLVLSAQLSAQRYHISYAPNSQEGLLLQLIETLEGPAKIGQIEAFLKRYPDHASAAWALSSLQEHHAETGEIDKAMLAGEKLLLIHPEDLEAATLNHELALKKGDAAAVKRWKDAMVSAAKDLAAASRKPQAVAENFGERQQYAARVASNDEFESYRAAVSAQQPDARIKAIQSFLDAYPASAYRTNANIALMGAHKQAGATQKALDVASKLLASDPDCVEALVTTAEIWLDRRSNYPAIVTMCNRVIGLFQKAPSGADAAEFAKRRTRYTGVAYQVLGYAHVFQNKFEEGDRYLRLALPFMQSDTQYYTSVLFYIGYANYYLEKYAIAADFFTQCLAVSGPMQERARRHLNIMKQERRIP